MRWPEWWDEFDAGVEQAQRVHEERGHVENTGIEDWVVCPATNCGKVRSFLTFLEIPFVARGASECITCRQPVAS